MGIEQAGPQALGRVVTCRLHPFDIELIAAAVDEPIALADLRSSVPWWPFGAWWTAKLIRDGKLPCVRIGRRVFLTRTLLDEYVQANVVRR